MILKVEQGKGYLNLGNTIVANVDRIKLQSRTTSVALEKSVEMQ